jgi:DNA-binding NarL/FixJ family response regulator
MAASVQFWRYSSRNREGHQAHPLTSARRNLILELWARGWTKEQVAFELNLDLDTISAHLEAGRKARDARAVIRHPATLKAMGSAK